MWPPGSGRRRHASASRLNRSDDADLLDGEVPHHGDGSPLLAIGPFRSIENAVVTERVQACSPRVSLVPMAATNASGPASTSTASGLTSVYQSVWASRAASGSYPPVGVDESGVIRELAVRFALLALPHNESDDLSTHAAASLKRIRSGVSGPRPGAGADVPPDRRGHCRSGPS